MNLDIAHTSLGDAGQPSDAEACQAVIRRSRNMLTFAGLTALKLQGFPDLHHTANKSWPIQACVTRPGNRTKLKDVSFIYWTIPFQTTFHEIDYCPFQIVDPITASLQSLRFVNDIEAVVLFDHLLSRDAHSRATTRAELERILYGTKRFKGKERGKWALNHAVEGTDSPMESRLRIKLWKSRFPKAAVNFKIQHPVTNETWFADLAYPKLKIAVEYQGTDFHISKDKLSKDSRKISALQGLGWNVIPLTSEYLLTEQGWQRFSDTLRSVIASRSK
ncbi:hypothetical protein [Bifidobacterium sp.]|uniref:hypothetical protein n=1 Tax=Bifidobacterium sp. TaxID=41200 RepID=UPI0039EC81FB